MSFSAQELRNRISGILAVIEKSASGASSLTYHDSKFNQYPGVEAAEQLKLVGDHIEMGKKWLEAAGMVNASTLTSENGQKMSPARLRTLKKIFLIRAQVYFAAASRLLDYTLKTAQHNSELNTPFAAIGALYVELLKPANEESLLAALYLVHSDTPQSSKQRDQLQAIDQMLDRASEEKLDSDSNALVRNETARLQEIWLQDLKGSLPKATTMIGELLFEL